MTSNPSFPNALVWTRSLWKTLIGFAVVLPILSAAPAAIAQYYQVGDEGPDVEAIQRALGISVDGIYGSETESAVYDFQARSSLSTDGIAGPETLDALGLDALIDRSQIPSLSFGSGASIATFNAQQRQGPYVVAVPGANVALLSQIRRVAPTAYVSLSGRGSYVHAGAFTRRSDAEALARNLRQAGLNNARVAYFP